jgi:acetyl-CoA carboxylase biotin carboxyl carrier protein
MDLTNEDVADILALLDSLPYDELDLQTPRFRLTLRRTPDGWTQSSQTLTPPHPLDPAAVPAVPGSSGTSSWLDAVEREVGEGEEGGGELVAVLATLPGTFYRAPRPVAAPFVEVGSRVGSVTVVGIVESM